MSILKRFCILPLAGAVLLTVTSVAARASTSSCAHAIAAGAATTSSATQYVRLANQEPKIHLGNYVERVLKTTHLRKVTQAFSRLPEINSFIPITGEELWLWVVNQRTDEKGMVLETVAPFGSVRYFRVTPAPTPLSAMRVELLEIPHAESGFPKFDLGPLPLEPARQSVSPRADQLAANQVLSDKNYDHGAVTEANRHMLEHLDRRVPLTLNEVRHWHRLAVHVDSPLVAGFLRGSSPQHVWIDGHSYVIDYRDLQIKATSTYGATLNYLPARQVPRALEKWLTRVNRVGPTTPFKDILSLYRDFIVIHPFLDGNGRISRILLNYMLLRAHFPIPKYSVNTFEVIYKTLDELYLDFLASY